MAELADTERLGDASARPRRGRRVRHGRAGFGLVVGALGVVYGDKGTSPLYSVQTVFSIDNGAVQPTAQDVFGVVSLVFWSITLIVSVKYVLFVMRADNDGEGGVMALAEAGRGRGRIRDTRGHLLRRQPHQGRPWWLAHPPDRSHHVHPPDDLAAWP